MTRPAFTYDSALERAIRHELRRAGRAAGRIIIRPDRPARADHQSYIRARTRADRQRLATD